jgi:type VI secretion system secreted protein Hcp
MANPIYIWFKGVTQGPIEGWGSWAGEDDQMGREGSSLVQAFSHEVTIPRDPQSGMASGRRVHHPLVITKRIDKASPKLYMALTKGERLTEVTVKWYRIVQAGGGGQEHYFTTKLEEAVIVSIKDWFPITMDPQKRDYSHLEDISLTYRSITWTWEDGGITSTDDWRAE